MPSNPWSLAHPARAASANIAFQNFSRLSACRALLVALIDSSDRGTLRSPFRVRFSWNTSGLVDWCKSNAFVNKLLSEKMRAVSIAAITSGLLFLCGCDRRDSAEQKQVSGGQADVAVESDPAESDHENSGKSSPISIGIEELISNPDPFVGKRLQLSAYFRMHIPDGPWLCADPKNDLKTTLSITNVGGCTYITEPPSEIPGYWGFESGWVHAIGTLRRGKYHVGAWDFDIENHLFYELETVTTDNKRMESND